MGLGLSNLSVEIFESFLKGLFIGEFCWAASIFTVKYSILAFYWRLFSKLKGARIAIRVLLAVVTCWAIAAVRLHKRLLCLLHKQDTHNIYLGAHNGLPMSPSGRFLGH